MTWFRDSDAIIIGHDPLRVVLTDYNGFTGQWNCKPWTITWRLHLGHWERVKEARREG